MSFEKEKINTTQGRDISDNEPIDVDYEVTFSEENFEKYVPTKNERLLAIVVHLSIFFVAALPLANFIVPAIILYTSDDSEFLQYQAKQALNFQIAYFIYMVIAGALAFLLIGIPFLYILPVINFIFALVATIMVASGRKFRYPLSIEFVK
jgi:uncharacterized Tic20 family protein